MELCSLLLLLLLLLQEEMRGLARIPFLSRVVKPEVG